jgi:peptidoglycan/LPS O-acetylase OafA/YrhL
VAVLAVIFFHAGFEIFQGGFVGVDVFFVISGYLITTIIITELVDHKFSLIGFYERRARRILPALFLVMIVCIPFAWYWFLPRDFNDFLKSLISTPLFYSNILFWRQSGYFDLAAEFKPLLHTWSLAIEEQYYLFFPIMLIFLWRFGRNAVLFGLSSLFFASFIFAIWAVDAKPAAAFYSLFARGWELLIGAFVAIYLYQRKDQIVGTYLNEAAALIGLLLIIWAILAFDKSTPFPGVNALVPTVGASLIIINSNSSTMTGRFLGSRVLVGIGLISYSNYLWHQPIFAFAKQLELSSLKLGFFSILILCSLLLGYLTWRFVESPFRRSGYVSCRLFIFCVFFVGSSLIIFGLVGSKQKGFKDRLPPNIVWQSLGEKLAETGEVCKLVPIQSLSGISACDFGDVTSENKIFLMGDSHAQAISHELNLKLKQLNFKGVNITLNNCGVIPQIMDSKENARLKMDCVSSFEKLKRFIAADGSPVILVARWSFRLYPIDGLITQMPYVNSEGGVERESYREYAVNENGVLSFAEQAKEKALSNFIGDMLSTKSKLVLVYPIPEVAWDIASLNWRNWRNTQKVLNEISIPYTDYLSRNAFVVKIFDGFLNFSNFHPVRPSDIFCNKFIIDRCVAQYNGIPFYFDDDHLSDDGARLLVDRIVLQLISHPR